MDYQFFLLNLCDLVVFTNHAFEDDALAKWILEMGNPSISNISLLKDRGNTLVKEANFPLAVLHYNLGLQFLCFLGLPPLSDQPLASSLAFSLILNLAFCELRLSNFSKARLLCNFVLHFEPCNVKALYRRGLAFKQMNLLTEALHDFESATKIDPSNKDITRELFSVVDDLALNINGKRVAYPFDPLASTKKGKKPAQSVAGVADKGISPSEAQIVSSSAEASLTTDVPCVQDEIGTSSDVMDFLIESSMSVQSDEHSDLASSTITNSEPTQVLFESMEAATPSSACTPKQAKFGFTNKKQAHKKLHLSAEAYNNLLLGKNFEFFHPRSGAVLRVRPLTPKTIQPGTLHGDKSWDAAVPMSDPLPDICPPTDAPLQTDCGSTDAASVQDECLVQTNKKKRLSCDTSCASKVSIIQFKFEAARTHSNEQVWHKRLRSSPRGQLARANDGLKKRVLVSVTCLSSCCRYITTSVADKKTKRRDDYPIQFDDYYPPFKKSRLGVSLCSTLEFSSVNWMSSRLAVFGTRPFDNG